MQERVIEMLDFNMACEMARKNLVGQGYKNGIAEITDLGDSWLFTGRMFDIGAPDYGNTPITVDKNTGEIADYPLSDIDNLDRYYEAEDIEIPKEFEIVD